MRLPLIPPTLRTAMFYPLIAVFAAAQFACGADLSTYTTADNAGTVPATFHKTWMSALPDSMLISELSIPGTHDSGCEDNHSAFDAGAAECQDADIRHQLEAGVRFLDLRVDATNGRWEIYHGAYQFRSLITVLNEIDSFLAENEGETVLCRIAPWSNDKYKFLYGYPSDNLPSWNTIAQSYQRIWQRAGAVRADGVTPTTYAHAATKNGPNFIPDGDNALTSLNPTFHWPTLGEVRGKMVMFFVYDPLLIENKGHASGMGWANNKRNPDAPADGFYTTNRDEFDNTNYGDKQRKDITHIIDASADPNRKALYATGLNIGWSFLTTPLGHAKVMNRFLLNVLNADHYLKKTGLVMMDYPGPGLLDSILALNFRHATSSAAIYGDFLQYASRLPWEDKLMNDQYNGGNPGGVPIFRAWRRLLKERLPSTEFNTLALLALQNSVIAVDASFDAPKDETTENFLAARVGPFDNKSCYAVFQSNRLPPKYTSLAVTERLNAALAEPIIEPVAIKKALI